jgi:hypothetical protein
MYGYDVNTCNGQQTLLHGIVSYPNIEGLCLTECQLHHVLTVLPPADIGAGSFRRHSLPAPEDSQQKWNDTFKNKVCNSVSVVRGTGGGGTDYRKWSRALSFLRAPGGKRENLDTRLCT